MEPRWQMSTRIALGIWPEHLSAIVVLGYRGYATEATLSWDALVEQQCQSNEGRHCTGTVAAKHADGARWKIECRCRDLVSHRPDPVHCLPAAWRVE